MRHVDFKSFYPFFVMHEKVYKSEYPLIDVDPHASRIVRYFRASDYAYWLAGTLGFPGAFWLWGE